MGKLARRPLCCSLVYGHSYGLWGGNHAVVLKGYDDEQGIVYLSDSINGNVTRNAQVFFGTWQQMDSQAVVIE